MSKVKIIGEYFRSLVATEKIRMGETIVDLPAKCQEKADKYSIEIIEGVHIDCADSPVGAINHSCDPNAAVRRGSIVAWRCIEPDEAITIDYRKTERNIANPFNCICGAKFCCGRVE